MSDPTFLASLVVECTATLFLFLVFLILYRHFRQDYLAYWTAGWFSLGMGLLALVGHSLGLDRHESWSLLSLHQVSLGGAALLAFFARFAFMRGRQVHAVTWLLFIPVCGYIAVVTRLLPNPEIVGTLPIHLLFAISLWMSGSLFWRLARRQAKHGAAFLAVAFALWGLEHAHAAVGFLLWDLRAAFPEWMGFVDTAIIMAVALGMIVFAFEEDRGRLLDTNRKLEVSEQQLKELAMRDPLTGLFNRRHFDHVAPQLEAQMRRLSLPLAVFVIDLNHFKETNDRDGHQHGDQILRAVSEFLRRETRAADLPFRWGGDEFLLLMTDLSPVHAEEKAQDLRHGWQAIRSDLRTDVTLAVGWACLEEDGLEAAIRRADRRMYDDKRAQHGQGLVASAS